MLLWFAVLAVAGTFIVFRDAAMDYRLVALGSLLPDVIDAVVRRGVGPMHSLVSAVAVMSAVMLGTIGRRRLRRRLLAIPIGLFAHLVLDLTWTRTQIFWWPIAGNGLGGLRGPLPSFDRPLATVLFQEAVGVGVGIWTWRRFGLDDAARRAKFFHTGRLDRVVAGPTRR